MTGARVLIVGLGDLGHRLALALAGADGVGELVLAGRAERGAPLARLAAACGHARTRAVALDVLDEDAVRSLLLRERPALIVQCASLLSPWRVPELAARGHRLAQALAAAGFALQLPAQLPPIATLMRAARAIELWACIVNCSYPDVTHPVLARRGLAPTIGVGNAGMIAGLARAALAAERGEGELPRIRVLAHHAHVTPVVLADAARSGTLPRPRIFVGENAARRDDLAFAGAPLPSTRDLNALTAAHAVAIARALLPGGAALYTSAPGPLGLPGGLPVRVADGAVTLDLPDGLAVDEARAFAAASAVADGIAAIEDDGTVRFTDAARAALAIAPELAAPLALDEAPARARLLLSRLEADA